MRLSLSFPLPISSEECRRLLRVAHDSKLRPAALPAGPYHHLTLYLPPYLAALYLSDLPPEIPPQHHITGLVYAAYRHERDATLRAEATAAAPTRSERDLAQDRFVQHISTGLAGGHIVMGEASTGFGKTRVILRLAAQLLERDRLPWVAVPTIAVMTHLLGEMEHTEVALPKPNVLLGRGQFVSVAHTSLVLDELDLEQPALRTETDRVREWLARGAPPLTPTSLALARWVPGVSHLLFDLGHIAPSMDAELCGLDADSDDAEPAMLLTKDLRAQALQLTDGPPRKTFTVLTHAMLGVMAIRQTTQLPYTHLLIDEAHMLENSVASVLGTDLSLLSLRAWLRHEAPASWSPLLDELAKLTEILRELKNSGPLDPYRDTAVLEAIRHFMREFIRRLEGKRAKQPSANTWLVRAKQVLATRSDWCTVTHTPVLRWPLILTGPRNIAPILAKFLWPVEAAALVSGTLYLPSADGTFTPSYQATKLGIEAKRLYSFPPEHASWVYSTPRLHVPAPASTEAFSYPKLPDSDDDPRIVPPAVVAWLDRISATVRTIAERSRGGTLVLCCSHRDVHELGARLLPLLGDRLLINRSTHRGRDTFIEKSLAGHRPIWLATGPAWTGIDLAHPDKSCPPEEDFIITDLVIPRIPYGLDKSAAHSERRARFGFYADRSEAMFRLLQGFGRLIRREGLIDRHLWFLDGRPWSRPKDHQPIRHLLVKYPAGEPVQAEPLLPR